MKLSSTSALVLLWAGREHLASASARDCLDRLDLGQGRSLFDACNAICPYYAEVIRNRKRGVRDFIERAMSENAAAQIIIAGAGLDPLGIDLAVSYPAIRVFEMDRENMDRKGELHASVGGAGNPVFVTADLADASAVLRGLRVHGWDPALPTALVLEGISYYLEPRDLRALAETLAPERIVAEYLKPETAVAPDRARIPAEVFGTIAGECALPAIHRHDAPGLARLFGMAVAERRGMTALEKARTGSNRYFPTEESGWIEVSLLERRPSRVPIRRG